MISSANTTKPILLSDRFSHCNWIWNSIQNGPNSPMCSHWKWSHRQLRLVGLYPSFQAFPIWHFKNCTISLQNHNNKSNFVHLIKMLQLFHKFSIMIVFIKQSMTICLKLGSLFEGSTATQFVRTSWSFQMIRRPKSLLQTQANTGSSVHWN